MFWIILGGLQAYRCFLCPEDSSSQWTQSRTSALGDSLGTKCTLQDTKLPRPPMPDRPPQMDWDWCLRVIKLVVLIQTQSINFLVQGTAWIITHSLSSKVDSRFCCRLFHQFPGIPQCLPSSEGIFWSLWWLSAGWDIPNLKSLILMFKQSWV